MVYFLLFIFFADFSKSFFLSGFFLSGFFKKEQKNNFNSNLLERKISNNNLNKETFLFKDLLYKTTYALYIHNTGIFQKLDNFFLKKDLSDITTMRFLKKSYFDIGNRFSAISKDPNFINPDEGDKKRKYDDQIKSLNSNEKISFDIYFGPPGTGKSLIPEAHCFEKNDERVLIKVTTKDFLEYDKGIINLLVSNINDKYKNKEVFVLFDEADSYFEKNSENVEYFINYLKKNLKINEINKIKFIFTTNLPTTIDEKIKNISSIFKFNDLKDFNKGNKNYNAFEKKENKILNFENEIKEKSKIIEPIIKSIIKAKFSHFFEKNENEEINFNSLKNGANIPITSPINDGSTVLRQLVANEKTVSFAQIEAFLFNAINEFYFSKKENKPQEQVNLYDIYKKTRFGGPKYEKDFKSVFLKKGFEKIEKQHKEFLNFSFLKLSSNNKSEYDLEKFKINNFFIEKEFISKNKNSFFENFLNSIKNNDENALAFYEKPIMLCNPDNFSKNDLDFLKNLIFKLKNKGKIYNLYEIKKDYVLQELKKENGELFLINLIEKIKKEDPNSIIYIQDLEELFYTRDLNYISEGSKSNPKHKIFINTILPYFDDMKNKNTYLFIGCKRDILDIYKNFSSAVRFCFNDYFEYDPNKETFPEFLKRNNHTLDDEPYYQLKKILREWRIGFGIDNALFRAQRINLKIDMKNEDLEIKDKKKNNNNNDIIIAKKIYKK